MKSYKGIQNTCARYWPAALTILLLIFVATGISEKVYRAVLFPVNQYNDKFLDESIEDAAHLMIPVGLAKGAADIIEGTTIQLGAGVVVANAGTEIEVGDALQPLLEYLNLAWRILILSVVFSTVSKYILLGSYPVAATMLIVSLSCFAIWFLFRPWVKESSMWLFALGRMAKMTLLVALVFLLILPLTIYLAAHLSEATTTPLQESLFASFDEAGQHFDISGFHSAEKITDKAKFMYDKSLELMKYSLTATQDIAVSVAKLFVIKLLNGAVFPLASLAFLVWLLRGVLYPALGLSPKGLSRDDFTRLTKGLLTSNRSIKKQRAGRS